MPELSRRKHLFSKAVLLVVAIAFSLYVHYEQFKGLDRHQAMDFEHYYSAAQILRAGLGAKLYDVDVQWRFESEFGRGWGPLFNYPAATALLYWPTVFFSLNKAFLLWEIVSLVIIVGSVWLLNHVFRFSDDFGWLALVTMCFPPVHACLMSGQLDAFLLLSYVMALVCLKSERPFLAGMSLALSLFKFHLVLPLVWIMLIRKQWRFLYGFSIVAAAFVSLCFAVAGMSFPTSYWHMLVTMQSLPNGGFHPALMPNLRGLLFVFTGRETHFVVLVAAAVIALTWVARRWDTLEFGFASATTATLLFTYHVYLSDLLLLIIPLLFAAQSEHWKARKLLVFGSIAVPVLSYILMYANAVALLALPIFLLLSIFLFPAMPMRKLLRPTISMTSISDKVPAEEIPADLPET